VPAWASAAPAAAGALLHRRLVVSPLLPRVWGRVALTDLRLGEATVHVEAEGQAAKVRGLPDDWQLITPQE
jgi:hypothetical protein